MPIGARNSSFRGRNLQGAACGLGGSGVAKQSDPGETDSPTRVKRAVRPGSNSQSDPGQTENPPWQAVSALPGRGWFSPAGEALPSLPAEAPHFAVASAKNTASREKPEFPGNPGKPGTSPEIPPRNHGNTRPFAPATAALSLFHGTESIICTPFACPLSENYVLLHPK